MADIIKKIRTISGDSEIDFGSLANRPKINEKLIDGNENILETIAENLIKDNESESNSVWSSQKSNEEIEKIDNTISGLLTSEKIGEAITDYVTLDGYAYQTVNGTVNSIGSGYKLHLLSVLPGEKYLIKAYANLSAICVNMLSGFGEFVSYYGLPNTSSNPNLENQVLEILVPNGVSTIRIQSNESQEWYVKPIIKTSFNSKNYKWCAIGDSLTDFNTLHNSNYVEQISSMLNLEATNLGVGGTGYVNGKSASKYFYTRISNIPEDTDIVTVFGSFNDLYRKTHYTLGQLGDSTNNTLYGAFQFFFDTLFTRLPNVVLGVILPTPWSNASRRMNSDQTLEYIEALKASCEYNSIPYLNLFDESGMRPWDNIFKENNYKNGDGIHPTTEAFQRYITPKIAQFIKKLMA